MKPELHEKWEKALSHIKNSEKLEKDKKYAEAEKEGRFAFFHGFEAMLKISKELEVDDLSTIAWNFFNMGVEREEKAHNTPRENIEWYRKVLKRFSGELSPYKFRPFR